MKRIVILILMFLLSLSGCSSRRSEDFDKIEIRGRDSFIQLEEKDAEEIYELIQQVDAAGFRQLEEGEYYIGGFTHAIRITTGQEVRVYEFLYDTLFVSGDPRMDYKIDMDFYQAVFYPTVASVFEKYLPLSFPLMNCPYRYTVSILSDVEMKLDDDKLAEFMGEMIHDVSHFPEAEKYVSSGEDPLLLLEYSDGHVIKSEVIALYDSFLVVRGRKLPYLNPGFPELMMTSDEEELLPGKYVLLGGNDEPAMNAAGQYESVLLLNEDHTGYITHGAEKVELYYDPELRFIHFINPEGNGDYEPTYHYVGGILMFSYVTGNDCYVKIEE